VPRASAPGAPNGVVRAEQPFFFGDGESIALLQYGEGMKEEHGPPLLVCSWSGQRGFGQLLGICRPHAGGGGLVYEDLRGLGEGESVFEAPGECI
jgi:hypothetical protein